MGKVKETMFYFVLTALIILLILLIQGPPLFINRKWRDLAIFFAFWARASAYALLVVAQVQIPTVTNIHLLTE
ncbi:MAG: hypothetical protein ACOYBM_04070 [Dethiobacteria bacterium]